MKSPLSNVFSASFSFSTLVWKKIGGSEEEKSEYHREGWWRRKKGGGGGASSFDSAHRRRKMASRPREGVGRWEKARFSDTIDNPASGYTYIHTYIRTYIQFDPTFFFFSSYFFRCSRTPLFSFTDNNTGSRIFQLQLLRVMLDKCFIPFFFAKDSV